MLNQLNLYGVIGVDVRAVDVKKALEAMDQSQPLLVKIDSEGGSVFEGFSIGNALAAYPGSKKIIVDPAAFSIASYIVSVFDEVEIADNGYIMAHLPYVPEGGNSDELSQNAELLRDIEAKLIARYSQKTGLDEGAVRGLLQKELFLNADQAMQLNLVTRVVSQQVPTRMQINNKMPLKVLASLRCEGQGGDNCETTKEKPVSNTQTPVAATVQDIKAAFPKAKADFIVRCLEKQLPLASVASAAAEEMMAENEKLCMENEELKAKLAAMEQEKMEPSAEVVIETEDDDEEEMPAPSAKAPQAKGKPAKPVANASSGGVLTATQRWDSAIKAEIAKGLPRAKAILAANKTNPGLREQMLAEVNSK